MSASYFVSAYATSPSSNQWNPFAESHYFQALAKKPEIIGIEHPFFIHSEKYTRPWLLKNLPDHWSIILTALPLFMSESKSNAFLGLASTQEKGRSQAVHFMEKMSHYVGTLNQHVTNKRVKAIHLHTFPHNDDANLRGHATALEKSLLELKNMNWHGVALNLEHCDAYIPNKLGQKNLLLLEDELDILAKVGGYGLVLNWARSAIEGRSALTPLQHIELAKKASLLRGFFFSGCSDNINSEYGYWKDTHMPPQNFAHAQYLKDDSLLGATEIKHVLKALNNEKHPVYLGVKVSDASSSDEIAKKVGLNLETIDAINQEKNSIENK